MEFKRKALGLAIGSIAAVALSTTALTAAAAPLTGTRYAADESATTGATTDHAADRDRHESRFQRHKAHRQDKRREQIDPKDYSREVERTDTEKGDHTVGHTATITNKETGNTLTHEQTTSRDPESGAITRTNEVTGSGGKTWSSETTATKTDDGHTTERTVTDPNGEAHTATVDVSRSGDQSVTKTVSGDDRTRETTVQRTDDGYTRTTEFNNGATTEVDASKASDGTWNREVTRTPGDATSDPDSATSERATSETDSSSANTSAED